MNIIYLYKLQSCIQATLDGQQAFGQTVNSIPIYAKPQCSCLLYFLFEKTCVVNCFIQKKEKTVRGISWFQGVIYIKKWGFFGRIIWTFPVFFCSLKLKKNHGYTTIVGVK